MIAREDRPGDKRLVGYVTETVGTVDPVSVRATLAERLPGYMVPAAVVVIDGVAVDGQRQARRRARCRHREYAVEGYRAPADAVEEILAGIFAEVLGVDRVGVDDSFFELGGDSILSMQVVARARAAGVTCRPRDVFVEQTRGPVGAGGGVRRGRCRGDRRRGRARWGPPRSCGGCTSVAGPTDQFNQTVVVQAPAGVSESDVLIVVQALLDRHAMLRLRVDDDGAGGWSLHVPGAGVGGRRRSALQVAELCPMRRWWRRGRG